MLSLPDFLFPISKSNSKWDHGTVTSFWMLPYAFGSPEENTPSSCAVFQSLGISPGVWISAEKLFAALNTPKEEREADTGWGRRREGCKKWGLVDVKCQAACSGGKKGLRVIETAEQRIRSHIQNKGVIILSSKGEIRIQNCQWYALWKGGGGVLD